MNPALNLLKPYPFTQLNQLLADVRPATHLPPISLHIGEPQHPPPFEVLSELRKLKAVDRYPSTIGTSELRQACADSLLARYDLNGPKSNQSVSNDSRPDGSWIKAQQMIVPVSGTREALFSFAQAVGANQRDTIMVIPNPFYQIYEGAALLAGASPYYLNNLNGNNPAGSSFDKTIATVPDNIWHRCKLLFVCSPSNPEGSCFTQKQWQLLIQKAQDYDFIIAADECYADIYRSGRKPSGILEACAKLGTRTLEHCAAFHSLSKRSNLPGMRSGFVVTSEKLAQSFRCYRDYHGCTMPRFIQDASAIAWRDQTTAQKNRQLYDQKFRIFEQGLQEVWPQKTPQGGFYLWARTPYDERRFAQDLYAQENIKVLPGRYLARNDGGVNPGINYVRMAMVTTIEICEESVERLQRFFDNNF